MLKLGVYRLDQLRALDGGGLASSLRALLTRGRISIQLVAAAMPPSEKVAVFERIMPWVQLSSGVWRTTWRARFQQLDAWVNRILAGCFDASTPLDVHDWAASDCLTSSEWSTSLCAQFPQAHLTASDLTLFLLEAVLPAGDAFVLEPNGAPLQYIRPPFVIRFHPPEPALLPVNRLLYNGARSRIAALWRQWAIPPEWLDSESETLEQPPCRFRKISLIHPDADAARRNTGAFTVRKHSAFDALTQPCQVVRSMNIFNPSYFDAAKLRDGAEAVWRSLRTGGIWIVGRTWQDHPPMHRASIFSKEGRGFRLLDRYEGGSEIDKIVLEAEF